MFGRDEEKVERVATSGDRSKKMMKSGWLFPYPVEKSSIEGSGSSRPSPN